MANSPNKLSLFWQELKRRNVVRVITVYAGATFVIIELINNITEPLRLPDWTPTLVIVLLAIGFPVVIIFSWIYDVHPEGGMVKTGPTNKTKAQDTTKSSNSWKIASYISFLVIAVLVVLNIIPRTNKGEESEIREKSIAVLPFRNDSPEETEMYFINGTMESILDNLCKIQDLRIVSRTSVEQYRDNPKPIPVVGEEMNVSYIIEGSGLKHGENVRLTIQLIDAINDKHLWSNTFNRKTAQIFELQSEIAHLVAGEIEAIITPAEKERIKKQPTKNLVAYEFYQRGLEEMRNYWQNSKNREALEEAEDLFLYALEYDSTMAEAYVGLSRIFRERDFLESYYSGEFLDSALSLLEIALSYDDQQADAYTLKGWIHLYRNENSEAYKAFDRALQFNPNHYEAYRGKASLAYDGDDLVNNIKFHHKAVELNRDSHLPGLLKSLAGAYRKAGFVEKSISYYDQALILDKDSLSYYYNMMVLEFYNGFFDSAIEFGKKAYDLDPLNSAVLIWLGTTYLYREQYEESLPYIEKYIKLQNARGENIYWKVVISYTYMQLGDQESADYYIDQEINNLESLIALNRASEDTHLFLAVGYSIKGIRENALHHLREFNKEERMTLQAMTIRDNPFWDNVRDIPEFNEIFDEVEAKYQAEHERVRKWLMENDLL